MIKPVWIFGIDRNVQNLLGHEVYGQYQALLSFSIIFQILLDFGLQSYNNRTVAQAPEKMNILFADIIWAKSLLALGYFILLAGFGWLIGFRGHSFVLLLLLGVTQSVNSLLLYLRSNVSALHKFKLDSLLSISDKLFMVLICGALLFLPPWRDHFTIEWFIYAQIVAYSFSAGLAFWLNTRLGPIDWKRFEWQKVIQVCKESFPYALLIFSMAIYLRADSVIMERLLPNGKEEAGIFAASFRLLDAANNATGILFAGILLPMFGRLLAKNNPVQPIVRESLNLILPTAITAAIISVFLGSEIMFLLYTDMNHYGVRVFQILMCALPGFSIGYIYATLLTANGNLNMLLRIALVGVCFNLGMNFLLIPKYGALGAAIACTLTQVLLSVLNIRLAQKILSLKTAWKWMAQYGLFISLVLIGAWLVRMLPQGLLLKILLLSFWGLSAMFFCHFLSLKQILSWLKFNDKK